MFKEQVNFFLRGLHSEFSQAQLEVILADRPTAVHIEEFKQVHQVEIATESQLLSLSFSLSLNCDLLLEYFNQLTLVIRPHWREASYIFSARRVSFSESTVATLRVLGRSLSRSCGFAACLVRRFALAFLASLLLLFSRCNCRGHCGAISRESEIVIALTQLRIASLTASSRQI